MGVGREAQRSVTAHGPVACELAPSSTDRETEAQSESCHSAGAGQSSDHRNPLESLSSSSAILRCPARLKAFQQRWGPRHTPPPQGRGHLRPFSSPPAQCWAKTTHPEARGQAGRASSTDVEPAQSPAATLQEPWRPGPRKSPIWAMGITVTARGAVGAGCFHSLTGSGLSPKPEVTGPPPLRLAPKAAWASPAHGGPWQKRV